MVKEAHAYFTIYFVKKYVLFYSKNQCIQTKWNKCESILYYTGNCKGQK